MAGSREGQGLLSLSPSLPTSELTLASAQRLLSEDLQLEMDMSGEWRRFEWVKSLPLDLKFPSLRQGERRKEGRSAQQLAPRKTSSASSARTFP